MELPHIWPVSCHTNHIGSGSTFVAIEGQNLNGLDFIPAALVAGAKKIVVASDVNLAPELSRHISDAEAQLIRVDNTRRALAQLSAQAYGHPARRLKIIGITGTKGKTTTACITYQLLRASGYSVALMSTVYNKINDACFSAPLTTPQPDYLHAFLNECIRHNVAYVVMEVAAQATTLHRVEGIEFDAVAFTNFGHEHSEFYDTFDAYFNAKVQLLHQAKDGAPILINADDVRVKTIKNQFPQAHFFSMQESNADFYAHLDTINDKLSGRLVCCDQRISFECPHLWGAFNGANVLVACGLALSIGVPMKAIGDALSRIVPIPGRLEQYELKNGVRYIIDYAHTPESYEQVLSLLRAKTDCLMVIFGAGGARDASKRPIMGAIAARYADRIFLTNDNPRTEDPYTIVGDILSGIPDEHKGKVVVELDREKAIKDSYTCAQKHAIIALLGKGPDEYQLIDATKIPFSEKTIVKQLEQ